VEVNMSPPLSVILYFALLAAVGVGRLVEMRISRRRQRALAARGAARAPEPGFLFMVLLHTGVLVASAVEVIAGHRPFLPAVGIPALALVALANALRWWVIATLGPHWNVQVMRSMALGVVATGPYRFVRHPNYVAVFVELLALPLVHGAWVTALAGTILHLFVLRRRIALEESVLMADGEYRRVMGPKPRFIPGSGPRAAGSPSQPWPTS
jgi:methyltransferase